MSEQKKNLNLLEDLTEEQDKQLTEYLYSRNALVAIFLIAIGIGIIIFFGSKGILGTVAGILLIGLGIFDFLYLRKHAPAKEK